MCSIFHDALLAVSRAVAPRTAFVHRTCAQRFRLLANFMTRAGDPSRGSTRGWGNRLVRLEMPCARSKKVFGILRGFARGSDIALGPAEVEEMAAASVATDRL